MRHAAFGVSLCAFSTALQSARAADWYASPNGSGDACSAASPCLASTVAGKPNAGDTVHFHGGNYTGGLFLAKSGSASAWITYAALDGEVPVFMGSGISSDTATYVRFVGLVSMAGAIGFGNGWTGSGTTGSNGHWELINCIADGNAASGIAFHSATGVHVKECIVAHNGSGTSDSPASGVKLFGVQGSAADNVVESTVSFENIDLQRHTDGSGFSVDDLGTGASLINNIGFRNGGSCIRLTTSTGTHLVNNTCYHDGIDPGATSPDNPGEIFFSDGGARSGVVMVNNLAAAAGYDNMMTSFVNPPAGISNNYSVDKNEPAPFLANPDGLNPYFLPNDDFTDVVDAGTATNAPLNDIGFDERCITKLTPCGQSFWEYSIDYAFITSIGGVAKCFASKLRVPPPDIGAYEAGTYELAGTGGTATAGSAGSAGAAGAGGMIAAGAGSGGSAAKGYVDDRPSAEESGCGCRVGPARPGAPGLALLALAGIALARRGRV